MMTTGKIKCPKAQAEHQAWDIWKIEGDSPVTSQLFWCPSTAKRCLLRFNKEIGQLLCYM